MSAIIDLFRTEPTVVIGTLGTLGAGLIALAVSFGLPITEDQRTAVYAVAGALGTLISLLVIRSQVTPNSKTTPAAQNIVVPVPAPPTPPSA